MLAACRVSAVASIARIGLKLDVWCALVQGLGGHLSREHRQELRRFLTDTNYQHAKLGGAFPPLHALRSPKCEDQGAAVLGGVLLHNIVSTMPAAQGSCW